MYTTCLGKMPKSDYPQSSICMSGNCHSQCLVLKAVCEWEQRKAHKAYPTCAPNLSHGRPRGRLLFLFQAGRQAKHSELLRLVRMCTVIFVVACVTLTLHSLSIQQLHEVQVHPSTAMPPCTFMRQGAHVPECLCAACACVPAGARESMLHHHTCVRGRMQVQ